jgi:hypothetical protein
MTGTTGRVFPIMLHPISFKSDGYGTTFEGFFGFANFLKVAHLHQNTKSAIPIYYIPISRCSIVAVVAVVDVVLTQYGSSCSSSGDISKAE